MFSTGFSSGDFDGNRMIVRFYGTINFPVLCHPARSIKTTAWALWTTYLLISLRCNFMAYDAIVDAACDAWNALIHKPKTITSIWNEGMGSLMSGQ